MALYADRVKETTNTTGTGTYSLLGPTVGYTTFVVGVGTGSIVTYCATDNIDWEIGEGTVTDAATDTLTRTTILDSSNGGAAVVWAAGTKEIFLTAAASRIATTDRVNTFTPNQIFSENVKTKSVTVFNNTAGFGNTIQSGDTQAANYTYTLPLDDGTASQVLATDGAGILSWATAAASDNTVPYYIPIGETFTNNLYRQSLFATTITIDGTLVVDGLLIEVD